MIEFDRIESAACARLGGSAELEAALVRPEPPESLAMIGDDRYLSVMCRRIFRAGLTHRLVDARWPAFEAAFDDFRLEAVAALSEDDLKRLASDEQLIRHRRKIFAVRDNARAMQAIVDEFGSFGFWLAEWPEDEIVELWAELKTRFAQLGGQSGPAFLRMAGKDTFLLTDWVARAMSQWQVYSGKTNTRSAHQRIQALFNMWNELSGRPYCQLSQILAFSID
ncbi:DNA-3-methyladenine glycosylase I [Salinisphaera sp. RV14]|uniref:DNA-3-methyladenine glycosylase I n=1 Tax=unclassified Salinisphaera TaxID=2649847 RepID=UPI003F859F96